MPHQDNLRDSRRRWENAYSIHVGIDRVDVDVFEGWLPPLHAAERDARAMRELANSMGCATRLLLNEYATRESVQIELDSILETDPSLG